MPRQTGNGESRSARRHKQPRAAEPEVWTVPLVQDEMRKMARRMRGQKALLKRIRRTLKPSPDIEEREEGLKPCDVTTYLLGCFDCLLFETFPTLIATFDEMARMTDEQLEREFAQDQVPEWMEPGLDG